MAQLVEHILGKDEVTSSTLVSSSKNDRLACRFLLYIENPTIVVGFNRGLPVSNKIVKQQRDRKLVR